MTSRPASRPRDEAALPPKTAELGRGLLSALFMSVRTAQIHDPGNKAFERAVASVRLAAEQLFVATGGFSIAFVGDLAHLNGVRLRFEGNFDAMRTLRHILASKGLGGIEVRAAPSFEGIRRLILLFSGAGTADERVIKEELLALDIGVVGVQRFADSEREDRHVDRRAFAVQSYAKLVLAFREHRALWSAALAAGSQSPARSAPAAGRLRAVRVMQDLVELAGDRPDFLVRLATNREGARPDELHAANVALLAIAIGNAVGLGRRDLVDLGVAGLFHDVGLPARRWARRGSDDLPPLPVELLAELTPPDPTDPDGVEAARGGEVTSEDHAPLLDLEAETVLPSDGLDEPGEGEERLGMAEQRHAGLSFARVLGLGGLSESGLARALVGAEHHDRASAPPGQRPHLYARIVAVADAYDGLTGGLSAAGGEPVPPLDALRRMSSDAPGWLDPRLIDVAINLLRAFPVGAEVVLDSGERAIVQSHAGGTRWDRPLVRVVAEPEAQGPGGSRRSIDLMAKSGGRFHTRILGTVMFLGEGGDPERER